MYDVSGYIILIFALTIALIFLIIFLPFFNVSNVNPANPALGPYALLPRLDGPAVNSCGQNRATACVFTYQFLSGALNKCDELGNVCQAFSYNEITGRMKVVNPSTTTATANVDVFRKQ